MAFEKFDTEKFFTSLLLGFVAIQIISWLLYEYMDIPILKGGWIILLMLVIIFMTTLFVMGRRIGTLKKEDYAFVGLIAAVIILAFIFLPDFFPQIFTIHSMEVREIIKQTMISIFKLGG